MTPPALPRSGEPSFTHTYPLHTHTHKPPRLTGPVTSAAQQRRPRQPPSLSSHTRAHNPPPPPLARPLSPRHRPAPPPARREVTSGRGGRRRRQQRPPQERSPQERWRRGFSPFFSLSPPPPPLQRSEGGWVWPPFRAVRPGGSGWGEDGGGRGALTHTASSPPPGVRPAAHPKMVARGTRTVAFHPLPLYVRLHAEGKAMA